MKMKVREALKEKLSTILISNEMDNHGEMVDNCFLKISPEGLSP